MKDSTLQILGLLFALFWGCAITGLAQFLFNPNIAILIGLYLLAALVIYYGFLRWMRQRR